ncbi:phage neck terminator protein [Roseixanthobacter glucoisosaccharinicivorans]|uniref:phage neck terminator protein n=1 Tax=Roseixanthobacter glucoisosaccharinicivorans TaxID=3119923 RepID=UPI00372A87CD
MTNTSASGGYLVPSSPGPAWDDQLDDVLQAMIVGITGLPGSVVRPRWQPNQPKQPEPSVDWCAVGVTHVENDTFAARIHSGAGDGSDTLQRHATLTVMASFYGPHRMGFAGLLSDGLLIPQNLEAIVTAGLLIRQASDVVSAGDLFNQNWIARADVLMTFRRQINRTYPVLNVVSGVGTIHPASAASQNFDTEN